MSTIQYYHSRENGQSYTIAVNIGFTKKDLLELLLSDSGEIYISLGKARKHPDDPYIKKIGRRIAESKMENLKFKLHSVSKSEDKLIFILRSDDYNIHIRISNKSDKPHFIEAY